MDIAWLLYLVSCFLKSMFQRIILFLIILILAAAQVSLFPSLMPGGLAPDLVLLLVIFWTASYRFDRVWLWIVVAGLVLDALTFSIFGLNVVALTVAGFGVGSLAKRLRAAQKPMAAMILFGFVIFGTLAYWLSLAVLSAAANSLSGVPINFSGAWINNLFLKIFYNLVLFAFLYLPFRKMESFFQVAPAKTLIK